jgi:hypothetical protein
MNEPPLLPALVCQRCGATNPPSATKCWLCEGGGTANPYAVPASLKPAGSAPGAVESAPSSRVESRTQKVFSVLLGTAVVLALVVGVGLAVQEPGMLVPYLIVITPPFLATGGRALASVAKNEKPKASTLFLTFVWSGLFTAMALALLVVASVIAVFLWCIHTLAGAGR